MLAGLSKQGIIAMAFARSQTPICYGTLQLNSFSSWFDLLLDLLRRLLLLLFSFFFRSLSLSLSLFFFFSFFFFLFPFFYFFFLDDLYCSCCFDPVLFKETSCDMPRSNFLKILLINLWELGGREGKGGGGGAGGGRIKAMKRKGATA